MKYIIIFCIGLQVLWGIQLETNNTVYEDDSRSAFQRIGEKSFFGAELFNGHFKEHKSFHENSNYILNINDKISVKMWGTHEYLDNNLTIDKQGNIFIPEVGVIYVLGSTASQLQKRVQKNVQKVFNKDVHVYADVQEYQSISVYVTGSVENIGLYEGLSTDSILQFIDKAKGIKQGVGSFRNIELIRNKEIIRVIDLYDFLLTGSVDAFQFKDGDTLFIKPMKHYINIDGEVARPYIFELLNDTVVMSEIIAYVLPSIKANSFTVTNWNDASKITKEYALATDLNIQLKSGDEVSFDSNYYTKSMRLTVKGEHTGKRHIAISKGATLSEILGTLDFTDLSDIKNIKIYQKRVALVQKSLLEAKLKELERSVLTTDSASAEEAEIRASESQRILAFIAKARKVEPKGQLILDKNSDLRKVVLEEGDEIFIPAKSNFVVVDGEVNMPNALMYQEGKNIEDYIDLCGSYSDRADTSKILLIKANGQVLFDNDSVEAGDSILVLRKIDSKNTIWIKDITQILYQIAIGAAVALQF